MSPAAGPGRRRGPRRGLPLSAQLALLPFLLGLAAVLLITLGYYLLSRDEWLDDVALDLADISQRTAANLELLITERIGVVETLARHPGLRQAIADQAAPLETLDPADRRARIQAMQRRWQQAGPGDAFVAGYLTGPAARLLRTHGEARPGVYGEFFVTDRFGVLVGATRRSTTLAHAHKRWWQAAYAGGKGRVFLDDRGFDESVGHFVIGIVVPVRADDGTVTGILKANMLLRELLDAAVAASVDLRRAHLAVVRSGGVILREAGAEPLSTTLSSHDTALMQEGLPYTDIAAGPTHALVTAFAPVPVTLGAPAVGFGGSPSSPDHHDGNRGEYWGVLAERDVGVGSVLGIRPLLFAAVAGMALLFIGVLSGTVGHRLARPIRDVAAALERFETDAVLPALGDSGPREVRVLRGAFRSMARRLSEQTTSIDRLHREIGRRKAAEARANMALAELQQAYEKSLQVEKLSALGTFVGGIAHEVKNPLMGLSNYIDHVRAEIDDAELCGILDRAQHQVRRIERIVDGVLGYAGGGRREQRVLDLAAIVADVVSLLKSQIERGGVELTVTMPPSPPAAAGDREAVEQALVNLILNASQAVQGKQRREVHVAVLAEPGGGAAIAVSDSGDGVPPDLRQRIWEPFFTTKPPGQGTGLGLSVAVRNLSDAGAALVLDAAYRDGARFVIRLPAVSAARPPSQSSSTPAVTATD